jgi:riboflavin kinase/FMN adenylyltransferase
MHVHRNTDQLPPFKNAVVTIGTFDGVHLGHQQILRQLKAEAAIIDGETVIITFHPHPRKVVRGEQHQVQLLSTLEEKIAFLETQGIHHLVIVPFTEQFASLSAKEYVRDFLVEKFHPAVLIIGYDHRFGKGRSGNYELLEEMAPTYTFRVKEIPEHVLHTVTISSTRIRNALKEGKLEEANENIGYAYQLSGVVVEGDKRGRTIGFPTANLFISDPEKLVPADGVYAVTLHIEGKPNDFRGMMNIGFRPTVNGTKRTVEVNIFNFSETIYGATLQLRLHHYLRTEKKFKTLDELKAQLASDQMEATLLLAHL